MKRTNQWLEEKLYHIWENHFEDIPRQNRVLIKFGKKSRRQLGCIKWANEKTRGINPLLKGKPHMIDEDDRISLIIISKYFEDPEIPEEIVEATIAHELCHYAHGFNSPLKQLYNHPHKGGIIRKEMQSRGLGEYYRQANKWLKTNWIQYLKSN